MKQNWFKHAMPVAAVAGLLALAGCADKNNNGVPDSFAKDAGDQANKMLDEGKKRAAAAGKKLEAETKPALESARKSVADAAKNPDKAAANLSAATTVTPKVKAAIFATDALRGLPINVSSVGSSKTILLTGTVKTHRQRLLASKVATESGSGFKVQNKLVVKG